MPPKEPGPTPVTVPKASVKCPNCGTVNKVSFSQSLSGFTCSGCGQRVDGIKPVESTPGSQPINEIVCPQCGGSVEILPQKKDGKLFRCKTCGKEF